MPLLLPFHQHMCRLLSYPALPPQLRSTRGALSDVGGSSDGHGVQLGTAGEPFSFESHAKARGVKVATAGLSGVNSAVPRARVDCSGHAWCCFVAGATGCKRDWRLVAVA